MSDWKERTRLLVGDDGIRNYSEATVAVIGIGGVGGFAAEMLVRAGIGHLIVLDNDCVSESNKNRQILALDSTLGKPKCDVIETRLKDINPDLDLVCVRKYLTESEEPKEAGDCTVAQILSQYHTDYVVDAIDTLSPKLALINFCVTNKIPLVSSMGAGAKYDIQKVRIKDISESFECPLAHMVRKRLKRFGIRTGFKVVFSEEIPDPAAMVTSESRNHKTQCGTISYMPAVFGCACAQVVLESVRKAKRTTNS